MGEQVKKCSYDDRRRVDSLILCPANPHEFDSLHRSSRASNCSNGFESQNSLQSKSSNDLLSHMSTLGFLPSLSSFPFDVSNAPADHRSVATIRVEQGSYISSLIVNGAFLYAGVSSIGSGSNSIRVWQKTTMKDCAGFGTAYGAVKAMTVADGRLLSAHQDCKIRIWSHGNQSLRQKRVIERDSSLRQAGLQAGEHEANKIPKLLVSMPTVKNYLQTFLPPRNYVQVRRHHKRLWIEHVDIISMLAVGGTISEPILYSASWDRTIKVWRLSDFTCVESFQAHDDAINALLVAPDGVLYTASADTKLKAWRRDGRATGESQPHRQKHSLVASFAAHKSAVNALSLMKEGDGSILTLYSGGSDRGIVVWEREEGAAHMVARGILRGHRNAILCLASAENMLCSGSADRTIRIWQRRGKTGSGEHVCIAVLQGHEGPVKCLSLSMSEEGHLLYSSSLDREIKLWPLSGRDWDESRDEASNAALHSKQEEGKARVFPWKFPSL